jgi:hypothetical protein
MTKDEFLIEMDWFTEYYDYKMNKKMVEIWFESLKKYSQKVLNEGLKNHLNCDETTFFPSLGKIYKQCQPSWVPK